MDANLFGGGNSKIIKKITNGGRYAGVLANANMLPNARIIMYTYA